MIAVLSDIHGNYSALKAVINDICKKPDIKEIYILGDIIDYGAHSVDCISLLYDLSYSVKSVWGNHENYILKDMKSEITSTNERGKKSAEITKKELSRDITALSKLFSILTDSLADNMCSFIHSLDKDIYKYQHPYVHTPSNVSVKGEVLFVGHTHKSGYVVAKDTSEKSIMVVNPGSVGQPRNGDNRAQYITYSIDDQYVNIDFHYVAYDIDREAQAIVDSGRDFYYASRLYLGK